MKISILNAEILCASEEVLLVVGILNFKVVMHCPDELKFKVGISVFSDKIHCPHKYGKKMEMAVLNDDFQIAPKYWQYKVECLYSKMISSILTQICRNKNQENQSSYGGACCPQKRSN